MLVCQGVDAGGHQFSYGQGGAGVVTLVPEVGDMLTKEFAGEAVGIVAAGGIVDGRGVAAALVLGEFLSFTSDLLGDSNLWGLGADAVVMGTRVSLFRFRGWCGV